VLIQSYLVGAYSILFAHSFGLAAEACSENQNVQLHLSFVKTLATKVQAPHIDYRWEDLEASPDRIPRGSSGNYNEWVPFIALFPLTEAGMTVEVWNARCQHDVPRSVDHQRGRLVEVPYGKILILRADVVHAGGYATAASGYPRCQFYVYKTPKGALHATHPGNSYHFRKNGQEEKLKLESFYEHCQIDKSSFVW
jgi:hypothetical protein